MSCKACPHYSCRIFPVTGLDIYNCKQPAETSAERPRGLFSTAYKVDNMKKICAAVAAAAVIALTALPVNALAQRETAVSGTNIQALTLPDGYSPVTLESGQYDPADFGGASYHDVRSRFFTADTVFAGVRGDGDPFIKIDVGIEKKHPDYSALGITELEKLLAQTAEALAESGGVLNDSDIVTFGGIEYIMIDYENAEGSAENYRSRVVYNTAINGRLYSVSMESSSSELSAQDKDSLLSVIKSIRWDSSVTGVKFTDQYKDAQAGVFFFVPEGWSSRTVPDYEDAAAGFYCGDGEYVAFDYSDVSEMFSGLSGTPGIEDIARLLGCEQSDVVEASVNGREFMNALIFSQDALTADYHLFTIEKNTAYHFIYRSPGEDIHMDEFTALINSMAFYEPEEPEPSDALQEPVPTEPPVQQEKKDAGAALILISVMIAIGALLIPVSVLRFIAARKPFKNKTAIAVSAGWYAVCAAAVLFSPPFSAALLYCEAALLICAPINWLMMRAGRNADGR